MSKKTFASLALPSSAFGEWRSAGEDIWIEPAVAPWHGLFGQLDELGTGLPGSDTRLTLAQEAMAIFAACWRYGSYAHVLTQGAPLPEAIWRNPEAGRITNWEMRRIQIEFSAVLAAWWELEDTELERALHQARAAWEFLPMPQYHVLSDEAIMQHFAERMRTFWENTAGKPEAEKVLTRQWSVRQEANATVAQVYRNGPIESLHAGESRSLSTFPAWPHVRRLYALDLQRIANWTIHRLMIHLAARRYWRRSGFSILVLHGLREWSDIVHQFQGYGSAADSHHPLPLRNGHHTAPRQKQRGVPCLPFFRTRPFPRLRLFPLPRPLRASRLPLRANPLPQHQLSSFPTQRGRSCDRPR